MLCRELPHYMQKVADLPLGVDVHRVVYGNAPHENTDRVIEPQRVPSSRGAFPPREL
jgi:hypothetical protein